MSLPQLEVPCHGDLNCKVVLCSQQQKLSMLQHWRLAQNLFGLVADLGIKEDMPLLHCDCQSAIQLAKNPVFHAKTKHVDVKYHFIRELIEDKQLQLVKVHTTENPADLLTKGLPKTSFEQCRTLLGIG